MHISLAVILAPFLRPQAYLDPGSGSFLIQLVIAGLVGVGFIVKVYWKKIKGLFSRTVAKKEDDDQLHQ